MLLLLLTAAQAYELSETVTLRTGGTVSALLVEDLDGDGTPDLVVADDLFVDLRLSSGADDVDAVVYAMATSDLDDDGEPEVLMCTDEGLLVYRPGIGEALETNRGCTAVAVTDIDRDGDQDVVTADSAVFLWENAGDGTLEGPTDTEVRMTGAVLLAGGEQVVYAGEVGGELVYEIDVTGAQELDAGGSLGGLAATDDGPIWTRSDLSELVLADGTGVRIDEGPGFIASGDIDSDGVAEHAVLHPDEGVVSIVDRTLVTSTEGPIGPRPPGAFVMADLDGDGCPDVVTAVDDEISLLMGSDCTVGPDHDDDGWSTIDGDCDDDEDTVHPGAEELCDGLDNDCDGEADEGSSSLSLDDAEGFESQIVRLQAAVYGCFTEIAWDVPDLAWLQCEAESEDELLCELMDDGEGTVVVSTLDDEGEVIETASATVSAYNLDPILTEARRQDEYYVTVGEEWTLVLGAQDQGPNDVVTVAIEGAPPSLELVEEGTFMLLYTPPEGDEGEWQIRLTASDDDGGQAQEVISLHVQPATAWSEGTCCFGATAGIGLPLLLLLAGGRRRP